MCSSDWWLWLTEANCHSRLHCIVARLSICTVWACISRMKSHSRIRFNLAQIFSCGTCNWQCRFEIRRSRSKCTVTGEWLSDFIHLIKHLLDGAKHSCLHCSMWQSDRWLAVCKRASYVHFTGKWISEECVDGSVDLVNQSAATAADSDITRLYQSRFKEQGELYIVSCVISLLLFHT